MTEQERIFAIFALMSYWRYIELHPELCQDVQAEMDAGRIRISSREVMALAGLPFEVVEAAMRNAADMGMVALVSDD